MIKGFEVNGKHSYHSFDLRILSRKIGSPPKDDHTERVPFSNITYDFDSVYGASYSERMITYKLEFIEFKPIKAYCRLINILEWLHFSDRQNLYDDMLKDYFFEVREPTVSWSESHGIYTFDVIFPALPAMKSIKNPETEVI